MWCIPARRLRRRAGILILSMFLSRSSSDAPNTALVIDIGSGSVGAAICICDSHTKTTDIVWSIREYLPIKDITSTEQPLQEIITSVITIFLQIGNTGIKALHKKDPSKKIQAINVSVSAPWAYTVTGSINFTDEHPFEVTQELVDELTKTAKEQAFTNALANTIIEENDLEIVHSDTVALTVNGYPVPNIIEATVRNISLSHLITVMNKKIATVIRDSAEKVLPEVPLIINSYMSSYYQALSQQQFQITEVCLIHITAEATEVTIVRDNILTHVTHIAFGTMSIAREIALALNIPKDEAYTYLTKNAPSTEKQLTESKQDELSKIFHSYEQKVQTLLTQTGDNLAIPKSIFLHTPDSTYTFFKSHIAKAAKKTTGIEHILHPVNHTIFGDIPLKDTSLKLLASLCHTSQQK